MEMLKSSLGRLRIVAFFEGLSFLIILFVAMPLKYIGGYVHATQDVGMAHGVLFILYIFMVIPVQHEYKWPTKTTIWTLIASIIPFGTFIADKRIFSKYKDVKTDKVE